ncbi:MAG: alpha/beta hydrolase [Bdellovibrionales bacterium]|nr:alpha/beta hydrolase [Bdellovibrionales bacterium]
MNSFINKSAKFNLVFVPGGPGLSSISFNRLEDLKNDFGLYFFDPMGTTTLLKTDPTYEVLLNELKEAVTNIENVILCGHSAGGIQSIDLASRGLKNIKGVIVIGSPVTGYAFEVLNKNFDVELSDEQKDLNHKLDHAPTDQIYKDWFIAFRDFYFNPKTAHKDIEVIMQDSVCVKSYSMSISESATKENCLKKLKGMNLLKLYIAGDLDRVLSPDSAKHEANLGGFDLTLIKNAGHFAQYERPAETMDAIRKFLTNKGE